MRDIFDFADELGPIKIVHVYDPKCGLKAVVAIDNVARGPSIGGIRMAPDVSAEEAFRLARAMTMKNSAANLPHGGGKSVIFGDPKMAPSNKEKLIRAFARGIRDLVEYIPGPDMGTDERCMAWIKDEIGRAVGLPPEIGGIPLDEIGATGLGPESQRRGGAQVLRLRLSKARAWSFRASARSANTRRAFSAKRVRCWSRQAIRVERFTIPRASMLAA